MNLNFTNILTYQVALYIYGPAGTGKSTFIKILLFIMGTSGRLVF